MIPTEDIRTWVRDTLLTVEGLRTVLTHSQTELEEALMSFRDTSREHKAIVVPMPDEIQHDYEADLHYPLRSRVSSAFTIFIAGRRLDRSSQGDDTTLALKDAALDLFLTTAVTGHAAHCTVTASEPVTIQFDDNQGREAWKLTLLIRPEH